MTLLCQLDARSHEVNLVLIEPGITRTNSVENGKSPHVPVASSPYASLSQKVAKSDAKLLEKVEVNFEIMLPIPFKTFILLVFARKCQMLIRNHSVLHFVDLSQ